MDPGTAPRIASKADSRTLSTGGGGQRGSPAPGRHRIRRMAGSLRRAAAARKPGSILVVGGLVMFAMALVGLAIGFSGVVESTYMSMALRLPKFDYELNGTAETGNTTFDAFTQMRWVGAGVAATAIIWAGLARALEGFDEAGLVRAGTSNRVLSRSVIFFLFLVVFPPLWDGAAGLVESTAVWVLNPNYSFDDDAPCPAGWDDRRIVEEFRDSPFSRSGERDKAAKWLGRDAGAPGSKRTPAPGGSMSQQQADSILGLAEGVCRPDHRVRYVFGQMFQYTEVGSIRERYGSGAATAGQLSADVQNLDANPMINLFLGLTKALVALQILLLTFIVGTMTDVLVGVIIAALPVLLYLTLLPKVEAVANRFLDALPALLLLPLLSAVVITVGAGFIAGIGYDACDARTLNATYSCVPNPAGSLETAQLYAWVSSMGVVFLAVMLPVLLVPMLTSVVQQAGQTASSAASTAAMITGLGAAGAVRGGLQGSAAGLSAAGIAASAAAGGLSGAASGHGGSMPGGMGGVSLGSLRGLQQGFAGPTGAEPVVGRFSHQEEAPVLRNALTEYSGLGRLQQAGLPGGGDGMPVFDGREGGGQFRARTGEFANRMKIDPESELGGGSINAENAVKEYLEQGQFTFQNPEAGQRATLLRIKEEHGLRMPIRAMEKQLDRFVADSSGPDASGHRVLRMKKA